MKFQPGDTVSFINEKYKGVVKKILHGDMVVVEIEDGFEIPVRESELVKITKVVADKTPVKEPVVEPTRDIDSIINLCPDSSVIVASMPEATGGVLTGPVIYYLINKSGSDLLFTFFSKQEGKLLGRGKGIVENNSTSELIRFKREDLIDVQSFLIQALLYNEKRQLQISTIRNEFSVMVPGINNARPGLTGLTAFAAIQTIFSVSGDEEIPVKDLIEKYQLTKKPITKSNPRPNIENQSDKFGILENEREIDLHIEELVNDISSLTNTEMLQIQMRQFSKEMDHAVKNHFTKLVFIHGVGNGKLKNELRSELRLYNGVAFRDADHRKYGYGATEVIFK